MTNTSPPEAEQLPGPTTPKRLPLRRPESGRWVGGVAVGLAAHLNVPVRTARLGLVLLALMGGLGVALYLFLWVTVPSGDPAAAAREGSARGKLSPGLADRVRTVPIKDIAVGILLFAAATVLVASRQGVGIDVAWAGGILITIVGVGLAWSQLDAVERGRWMSRAGGRTPGGIVRIMGGVVLVLLGVLMLVGQDDPAGLLARSGLAALAMLAGVGLVLAPWWLRLIGQLRFEQEARAREAERADIAAHLHDSVLQTLTLIRHGAQDPVLVARLARAQERELREWLYDDRPSAGTSLAAELRDVVAEIEDGRVAGSDPAQAITIDAVVVGDTAPTADTAAFLQATREALVNAVAHGAPPISLYLEVGAEEVEVFVRDRGAGFSIDTIAPDRFGVREAIQGRIRRRGGRASVTSRPELGTEVHLMLPLREPTGENASQNGSPSADSPSDTASEDTRD